MQQKTIVSPQRYYPSNKLIDRSRYNNISLGKGERSPTDNQGKILIKIAIKHFPGPGTHNLPTIFGKSLSNRTALN